MNKIETPFFGIHDCMYAPHGTLEDACRHLRVSFYDTCSGDALQGLVESNELEMEAAPKGNADISVCIDKSFYMFSWFFVEVAEIAVIAMDLSPTWWSQLFDLAPIYSPLNL